MGNNNDLTNNKNIREETITKIKNLYNYLQKTNKDKMNTEVEELDKINASPQINSQKIEKEKDHIYIKFLENPNIISDPSNCYELLNLLINELNKDIKNKNTLFLPFLNLFPKLIEVYINSTIDDDINDNFNPENCRKNQEIFKNIIKNSFINRKILQTVYDYFSNLYNECCEGNISQDTIKKFPKIVRLWEKFYLTDTNTKINSTFCSIGCNFNVHFYKKIDINKSNIKIIHIQINLVKSDYMNLLKEDNYSIKINNIIVFEINYNKILSNDIKFIHIKININLKNIEIEFGYDLNYTLLKNVKLKNISNIENITILEKFFGEINSFTVEIEKEDNHISYKFKPIAIRNKCFIFHSSKKIEIKNNYKEDNYPYIKISPERFLTVNLINNFNNKSEFIDYLGGVKQFLPFVYIIKNLNGKINEKILFYFTSSIFKILIQNLSQQENQREILNKYLSFIFYLTFIICEININLIDNFIEIICNYGSSDIKEILQNLVVIILETQINKDKINSSYLSDIPIDYFLKPEKSYNELYKHYMKELFSWNNMWSQKNIFFGKNNENIEIKYKQTNYYTKNFQQPFVVPVLEMKDYYPKFSKLKKFDLYKNPKNKIFSYDFNLYNQKAIDLIDLIINKNNVKCIKKEECCLVKKTHHIPGKVYCDYYDSEKNLKIVFEANIKLIPNETCNNNEKTNKLCYGSIFECPEKDLGRIITINSKKILFILIREYYHRFSAIEIFTINKSYYFNFKISFNTKPNIILDQIKRMDKFSEIKNNKMILGYFNKNFENYLYPLFKDDITNWEKKINFYNNFDLLQLINIFSNRSFNDMFQYPIFPTLYNFINYSRDMSSQIGLQNISEESLARKQLILNTYKSDEEDMGVCQNLDQELHLFDIHYSNPVFVCNYLLRVFPFSFIAIEFQGDNFDTPQRLFYSIKSSLLYNLQSKCDLREMIPELYYLPELFYNKNNIKFKLLSNGNKIDDVLIDSSDLNQLEKVASFLLKMKIWLDEVRDINKWIDLIFGVNQKFYEEGDKKTGKKYQYYETNSYVLFKEDPNILNNNISMGTVNFGLLPYQLFTKNFPVNNIVIDENSQEYKDLKKLCISIFEDEHIKNIYNPKISFICKGRVLLDQNYINIINDQEVMPVNESYYEFELSKYPKDVDNYSVFNKVFENITIHDKDQRIKKMIFSKSLTNIVNYYFVGDIFGTLLIYHLIKTEDINKNISDANGEENSYLSYKKEIIISPQIKVKLIKKIYGHEKEIIYIDFNPRLNLLLTYAADNYINIYLYPEFKLINVIDTLNFRGNDNKYALNEVVLFSSPFPSIRCDSEDYIYFLTINGELIKKREKSEEEKGKKLIFVIDKNFGLLMDNITLPKY